MTVIGHSYGSTTAGEAALGDLEADRLVLIGSPGASARRASDYTVPEDEVYAATTPDDPITWAQGFHGVNPVHPRFGAQVFTTTGASGHSEYFKVSSESLENLALVVRGRQPTLSAQS